MNLKKNFKENDSIFINDPEGFYLDSSSLRGLARDKTVKLIEFNETAKWVFLKITCIDGSFALFFTSPLSWGILNGSSTDWKKGF
jgi:hypothetical protein